MKRVCKRPIQLDAVTLCYEVVHPYYYEQLTTLDYGECLDMDEFILEAIEYGVNDEYDEEYDEDKDETTITIYGDPKSFAQIQKYLEDNGFEITGAEFTYVPNDLKEVTDEQRETIDKMVQRLEDFDDGQNLDTNIK